MRSGPGPDDPGGATNDHCNQAGALPGHGSSLGGLNPWRPAGSSAIPSSPSTSSAWRRCSSAPIRGPSRIYEDEGLLCPARTPSNIRLYSENDIRRITWIRHLTRERGVNLAGIRILFELEERLGARILEALYAEGTADAEATDATAKGPHGEPAHLGDPRWPSDRPPRSKISPPPSTAGASSRSSRSGRPSSSPR